MAAKHPVLVAPVSASPTLVVDANASRSSLFLQNAGTVRCYLDRDNTVSAASSIYLDPGDTLEDESTDDWWARTASGTGDLRGFEVF